MELNRMRPEELRSAIERQLPLLWPVGATEYHGEHLPIGTDTLIAGGLCREIAARTDAVIAPALPYTQTMHWASDIRDGDVDFSTDVLYPYVRECMRQYVAMGFRHIYVMLGHQGREGLPAIVVKHAFRELLGEWTRPLGTGWSRLTEEQIPFSNLFGLVKVCDFDEFCDYSRINRTERLPVGHAGRGETQLILALEPELAQMEALAQMERPLPPWLDDVMEADPIDGRFWVDFCVDEWVRHLNEENERIAHERHKKQNRDFTRQ